MFEFYRLNNNVILALVMISSLCVAAQAMAVVAGFNRYKASAVHWVENLMEVCILIHSVLHAVLISMIMDSMKSSHIAPVGFSALRYGIFLMIVLFSIAIVILRRKASPLLIIPVAAFVLPFSERILGHSFPLVYILAFIFWISRALYTCLLRRSNRRREVSSFSIKEAMDALRTGLLYCGDDGEIFLMNRRMQELLLALTGKAWRNGLDIRHALLGGNAYSTPEPLSLDGEKVYPPGDGTAWLFKEHEMLIAGRKYIQIYAVDVSERWELTHELWKRENELKERGGELAAALETLDEIQRGEELVRLKSKVHDTMAQRLTVLMQVFRAEKSITEADLKSYADDMLKEVREEVESGSGDIETLCKIYSDIGVSVEINGASPQNPIHANFCADFIREGVTNAVRHGFATRVIVTYGNKGSSPSISVEDNGFAHLGEITEGGGIGELRRRLALLGGRLEIITQPQFILRGYF